MTTSSSRLAFADCFDFMDRALEDPKGARASFGDRGSAMHFRVRLHTARRYDREANKEVYSPGDPMYGISEYDKLTASIREDGDIWYIYLEHRAQLTTVESLSDLKGEDE